MREDRQNGFEGILRAFRTARQVYEHGLAFHARYGPGEGGARGFLQPFAPHQLRQSWQRTLHYRGGGLRSAIARSHPGTAGGEDGVDFAVSRQGLQAFANQSEVIGQDFGGADCPTVGFQEARDGRAGDILPGTLSDRIAYSDDGGAIGCWHQLPTLSRLASSSKRMASISNPWVDLVIRRWRDFPLKSISNRPSAQAAAL